MVVRATEEISRFPSVTDENINLFLEMAGPKFEYRALEYPKDINESLHASFLHLLALHKIVPPIIEGAPATRRSVSVPSAAIIHP